MKKHLYLVLFPLLGWLVGCSSDTTSSASADDPNPMYLKAYLLTEPDMAGAYDAFYEYQNGFLTSGTGFNSNDGTHQYDAQGKLTRLVTLYAIYNYSYDAQGRLIKRTTEGSNNFTSFTYSTQKVSVRNYYVVSTDYVVDEKVDLYLNSAGKIVKLRKLTPDINETDMVQEYVYDSRGNIIQQWYRENNFGYPDRLVTYTYDTQKNPFYYAFKKRYKSTYYQECWTGVPTAHFRGMCPNNLTAVGTTTYVYTYNAQGYPTSSIKTYYNGGSTPAVSKYSFVYW